VGNVHEELRSAALRLASVRHGKSSWFVADSLVGLTNLVGDSAAAIALVRPSVTTPKGSVGVWTTSTGTTRVGILRIWATKLIHEVGNYAVKVNTIVESTVGQIDEVTTSNWHLVSKQLGLEGTHGGLEGCGSHGKRLLQQ